MMVDLLFKWQSLIGAIIGGLLGVTAALIVANKTKKEEQMTSAMLLIMDLTNIKAAVINIEALADKEKIEDDVQRGVFMAEKLMYLRPKLSPLFEASMMRVNTADKYIAIHLSHLNSQNRNIDDAILRIKTDFEMLTNKTEITRSRNNLISDTRLVRNSYIDQTNHAEAAMYYMQKIILGNFTLFYKIRRKLCINEDEKKYMDLIK